MRAAHRVGPRERQLDGMEPEHGDRVRSLGERGIEQDNYVEKWGSRGLPCCADVLCSWLGGDAVRRCSITRTVTAV